MKISKKNATLFCQLFNQNKRCQHRTKTKLAKKNIRKNKSKQQRKRYSRERAIRARNTEANLANGILHPKSKNEFSVAHFLK